MKNTKYTLALVLAAFSFFWNCEAKPVEDTFGLSPEETNVLIAGLIANRGSLVDNYNGTVTDSVAGLQWQKCSSGQVYRLAQNDCLGASAGTVLNPHDPYRYGANQVAYCDSKTHACNTLAYPQTVTNASQVGISGSSELFAACSQLGSNWRVPNLIELQRLTVTGRSAVLLYFPSTVEGEYWSSWANETDIPGETAYSVSFDRQSFGTEKRTIKTDRNYVRCIRNL
ncbi:surface adhesin Lsa25 [Leptospira idonii]|uniref:DUF1566 domain-containing protein n=1 Tax=Leptospira idonii TaxID=1193500 RepID=A0A4R9M164_9LEPT|nr:DUF1566 domain-containing protein [Leptospira idonii]TGN19427.1 DUF1566 domain-containing protein [Leptospira idonii]